MEITPDLWMVILICVVCSVAGFGFGTIFIKNRKRDDLNSYSMHYREPYKSDESPLDTDEDLQETTEDSQETDESPQQTITVYGDHGNVIKEYRGRFDVDSDDYCVYFDDENGKSHEIYYGSGIVIVDEE